MEEVRFTGKLPSLGPQLSKNTTKTEGLDKNQGSAGITVVIHDISGCVVPSKNTRKLHLWVGREVDGS